MNHLLKEGWIIAQIPLWVVSWVVFWVLFRVVPHCFAKTIGSTDAFLTMLISTMLIWIWANNAVARLSSSIASMPLYTNEHEITVLKNTGPSHYHGRGNDLTLMICNLSLIVWIFFCWWIPWRSFCSEMDLWNLFVITFCNTWRIHIKITGNTT